MTLRQWLKDKWCYGPPRNDNTKEVLAEAERTRVELVTLTGRLDEYVSDLRARVRLELRRDIKGATPHG